MLEENPSALTPTTIKLIRCLLLFEADCAKLKKNSKKNMARAKEMTIAFKEIFGLDPKTKIAELTDQQLSEKIEQFIKQKLTLKNLNHTDKNKKNILGDLFIAATQILHQQFAKEVDDFKRPLFGLGKNKSLEQFVNSTNNGKNSFVTLIAISIQCLSTITQARTSDLIPVQIKTQDLPIKSAVKKIKIPDDPIYQKQLKILITLNPNFSDYKKVVCKSSFSRHQLSDAKLYRLYHGQDTLTVELVKTLWPDIMDLFQGNDKLIQVFIESGVSDYVKTRLSTMKIGNSNNILEEVTDSEKEARQKKITSLLPSLQNTHQNILYLQRKNEISSTPAVTDSPIHSLSLSKS